MKVLDVLDVVEERVDCVVPRPADTVEDVPARRCGCAAVAVEDDADAGADFREQLEETHD